MGHYSSGGPGERREVRVGESHISTHEVQSELLLSLKNDYFLPEGTITYPICFSRDGLSLCFGFERCHTHQRLLPESEGKVLPLTFYIFHLQISRS